jgi:hypothetical protein
MAAAASRRAASAGALTGAQLSGLSPLLEQAAPASTISQSPRSVIANPFVIKVDKSMPSASWRPDSPASVIGLST